MPSEDAVGQEARNEGRNVPKTVKFAPREARAVDVIAEIRELGVSTLLHSRTVADIVAEYDRFIEMARKAS